ncbi:hypothetical protein HYU21_04200 [Candidatus Woesearchaeota archaeon]|nr:hypothetical protein [Candidatus Woesearchaeota archaeon]
MDIKEGKKGQLTIFIILGLVILVVGSIFYLYFKPNLEQPKQISSNVEYFINDCLKKTLESGIKEISLNGGEYLPQDSTYFSEREIKYYLKNGVTKDFPNLETEISKYVAAQMSSCLTLSTIPNVEMRLSEIKVDTKISSTRVIADLYLPVIISQDQTSKEISNFQAVVSSRLGEISGVVQEFITLQAANPDYMLVSKLMQLTQNHRLKFKITDRNEGITIYSFTDKKVLLGTKKLIFQFAVKYNWQERLEEKVITPIENGE